ncbi:trans-sulfuration enzyme family protein [Oleisolibacter albus]|uniref:trans-sulfuration enzyme family protein n=1 Tax=Oleisolibacter albus TaxID=2171757 RepID=UPI000DF13045|nr:aminotransferase class I/II-fold pyridoxal phosphate-dependent enzyme [Oleisolibacter albus]
MTVEQGQSPETWLARALGSHDAETHGVVPGIHPATTFLRGGDLTYPGLVYARPANPTFATPEALLSKLEGAAESLLFGSGMAAATAVFQALQPGDHVVAPKVMYWALRRWLKQFCAHWGLGLDLVDMTDSDAIAAAVRPGRTRIVWVETPANPTWDITDLAAAADIAHRAGARLVVDNTVPTPLLTRPIEHGADIVMHAATKYLNGHSDVLMGTLSVATPDAFWQRIRGVRGDLGGIPGPFEAWLLLRGMRTLALRVDKACANAQAVAEHFHGHPRSAGILYPGLPDHPGHGIAARQMRGGFGGMLSLRVAGGEAAAVRAAARLQLWTRATSLGGVESLVEHRASVEGPDSPCPPDLLRLSCGIESAADLIADLEQALAP